MPEVRSLQCTGLFMVILLTVTFTQLFAQIPEDTRFSMPIAQPDWRFALSYNQDNNIYFWKGNAQFSRQFGGGFLKVDNSFDINRITTTGTKDKWKDINRFNAEYTRPVTGNISTVVKAQSSYLTDRQTGFLNNISENSLTASLPILFRENILVSPIAGFKWDKRIDTPDHGLVYGADLTMRNLRLGEYYSQVRGNYLQESLDERNNHNRSISLTIHRQFSEMAHDTLKFNAGDIRRDYYTSAAGELESRNENVKRVLNDLYYQMSSWGRMKIHSDFQLNSIDILSLRRESGSQRRTRNDTHVKTDIEMDVQFGSQTGKLFFRYDRTEQNYENLSENGQVWGSVPFDIPDNTGTKVEIGGTFEGMVASSQRYRFETYVENFRFDTPSDENYDDHDEFRIGYKAEYAYALNERLTVSVNSLVSLHHLVYIFKERSADNNWNRVFQAGSRVDYTRASGFRISGNYSVLANYVDYDFDNVFVQHRSFVFRKFSLDHSAVVPVSIKGSLKLNFRLDLEENGQLSWRDFLQNVLLDREVIYGSVKYDYKWSKHLTLTPGYMLFRRNEARARGGGIVDSGWLMNKIEDNGIALDLKYQVRPSASVNCSISKRFVTRGGNKEHFQYVDLGIDWLF